MTSPRGRFSWPVLVVILALCLTMIPYVYGWLVTPPGKVFQWNTRLHSQDLCAYLAWMQQSAQGRLLFDDPFTTEPHHASLFMPLFLVGGWLSILTRLPVLAVYHILRVVLGAALLGSLWSLTGRCWVDQAARRAAFLLIVFSSGLGWLASMLNIASADNGIPEAITFATLYQVPLFSASLLLMVLIFSRALFEGRSGWKQQLYVSSLGILLAWLHPYDLLSVFSILLVWTIARWISSPMQRKACILSLIPLGVFAAALGIQFVLVHREPVFRIWSETVPGLSPSPTGYLLGYGLLLPLSIIGFLRLRRCAPPLARFLVLWVLTGILLLYAPVSFQRRFVHGIHVPIALLAGGGLDLLLRRLFNPSASRVRASTTTAALACAVIFLGLSNMRLMSSDMQAYRSGRAPFYLKRDYLDAFQWLAGTRPADGVVLSTMPSGSFIAGLSGHPVYLGHPDLTLLSALKKDQVAAFFTSNDQDDAKHRFLVQNGIAFVFLGEIERGYGGYDAASKAYLREVFRNRAAAIFEVAH